MPRYDLVETLSSPVTTWTSEPSTKWIEAPNPDEAIAIYETRHTLLFSDTAGNAEGRLLRKVYDTKSGLKLTVEVYPGKPDQVAAKIRTVAEKLEEVKVLLRSLDGFELMPPTDVNVDDLTGMVLDAQEQATHVADSLNEYADQVAG